MGFGDFLSSAWNGATDAAKSVVNSTVNGAKYVGQKTVEGAQMAWDGTKYVAQKTAEGAQYVGGKVVDTTKGAVRAGTRKLADTVYTPENIARAQKAKETFGKVKDYFSDKPPAQPCIACQAKDVNYDGALMGFKDGKCVPVTEKGQPVDDKDIAAAKQAGYDPQKNPADNTSQATKDCCAKCSPGGPKRTIIYVNGINTTKQTHCDTLKQIGDSTCANVIGVYNATEPKGTEKPGEFALEDARQTAKDRELIRSAANGNTKLAHDGRNPAVDTLSDVIVQEQQAGRSPEIWAHSQGGAVTSLALYDANNQLKAGSSAPDAGLNGVKVNSFGAASPTWVKGPEYNHYVNVNDFTPMNFGIGDNPSPETAGGGTVHLFSGEPHKGGNKAAFETKNPQKHALSSPTNYHGVDNIYLPMYEQANKRECNCNK